MVKSRVSSKGQITLPKAIREALGLRPGEEVVFELREGGPSSAPGAAYPWKPCSGA